MCFNVYQRDSDGNVALIVSHLGETFARWAAKHASTEAPAGALVWYQRTDHPVSVLPCDRPCCARKAC